MDDSILLQDLLDRDTLNRQVVLCTGLCIGIFQV